MKKITLLLLLLFANLAWSETPAQLLQTKLRAMHSMTAQFKQVVKAKQKEVSRSTGNMALQRPGRFLWQTNSPMEQLVLANGKKMWVYDAMLEQVTVKKQEKGLGGTAALFLSGGDEDITRDFEVQEKQEGKTLVFNLKAISAKASFQAISLHYEQDKLVQLVLHDQLGQTTVVSFSLIKNNPTLASSMFEFKPPKGVDVVTE